MTDTPGVYDVLCGRGKFSLTHVGNRRFRVRLATHLDKYLGLKGKAAKSDYLTMIVQGIRSCGGRFLKKNRSSGLWEDIGDKLAREKVGHALRDAHSDRLRAKRQQRRRSLRAMASSQLSDIGIPAPLPRHRDYNLQIIEEFAALFDDLIQQDEDSSEESSDYKLAKESAASVPIGTISKRTPVFIPPDFQKDVSLDFPTLQREVSLALDLSTPNHELDEMDISASMQARFDPWDLVIDPEDASSVVPTEQLGEVLSEIDGADVLQRTMEEIKSVCDESRGLIVNALARTFGSDSCAMDLLAVDCPPIDFLTRADSMGPINDQAMSMLASAC